MVMLRLFSSGPVFLAFPPIVRPQRALQAAGRGPLGYGLFRFASSSMVRAIMAYYVLESFKCGKQ
jgi:hypothetical protein